MARLKRIGKLGWIAISLAVLAAALFGAWRYAMATNPVAVLDTADRLLGGSGGARLALTDGRYGPLPAQRVEVMVPDEPSAAPRGVLVFIHGGSWNSGNPGNYHFIGRTFAREGFVVVLAGYRLGQDGAFPHMLEDSAKAVAWVNANIARYGGDPGQVVLMGHSAGAYNVVMLALERQWLGREGLPDNYLKGVVGLSGPYDFYPWTSDATRAAFGHVAEPAQTQPITFARGDAPPLLLITGDQDTTVKPRNTLALTRKIGDLGGRVRGLVLPGIDHVGTVTRLAAPFRRDRRVLDAVLPFLKGPEVHPASAPVQAEKQ